MRKLVTGPWARFDRRGESATLPTTVTEVFTVLLRSLGWRRGDAAMCPPWRRPAVIGSRPPYLWREATPVDGGATGNRGRLARCSATSGTVRFRRISERTIRRGSRDRARTGGGNAACAPR